MPRYKIHDGWLETGKISDILKLSKTSLEELRNNLDGIPVVIGDPQRQVGVISASDGDFFLDIDDDLEVCTYLGCANEDVVGSIELHGHIDKAVHSIDYT